MRKLTSKSYEYIEKLSDNESPDKIAARKNSEGLGLGAISLSKAEAQILQFLVLMTDAGKVVEIGTLTGLSALYILDCLKTNGQLWTLEKSAEHAALAEVVLSDYIRKNQCHILVGDAKEELAGLVTKGPFDVIFIDGNKAAYLDYFHWAVKNVKVGGLIVADNVFLAGAVWGDNSTQKFNEKQIKVVKEMNQLAFADKNLKAVVLPTEEGLLVCKKIS